MKVEFYRHALTAEDREAVDRVLQSVFLTTGPAAGAFESAFAAYTGIANVVSLNSCTGALHLALLALGIGPGDEVIVPAMTFIASATPVWHVGATPVLVDVEPDTGLMDVEKAAAAVTPRTRAIVPVHLYGAMADMKALRALCDKHKLALIEDAAHCVEGERDGVRPGHLGDAACYSFYATKNLTCGEGGALACRDAELAAKVRLLRQHGMSKEAADRYSGMYQHWDMVDLGWKYNISDILAVLLVRQIERLDAQLERRQALFARYDALLGELPGLDIPRRPGKSACHLYTVWAPEERRDEVLRHLQSQGVGVAVNYRAIHILSYFKQKLGHQESDFPVAARIGRRTLSLPLYLSLTEQEQDYVAGSLAGALQQG